MKPLPSLRILLALLVISMAPAPAGAQTRQSAAGESLFETLASQDRRLFDAYNTCDTEAFASFFVEDVEFYHDKTGATRGRETLIHSLKDNICGKTRRELIPATLEVHPMDGYGALQLGAHRFCQAGTNTCEGVGKFIHLWQHRDGAWKITRVISYDHTAGF